MSGVKYNSKRNNIIPGALPVVLPINEGSDVIYHPADYKGCFGFHEPTGEEGRGVMYYSTGNDWVTMDRVPILRPSARLPTNSAERKLLRLTPYTTGKDFDDVKHTRTGFQIYLNKSLTIQYKRRFDFIISSSIFDAQSLNDNAETKIYLTYTNPNNNTTTNFDCGYLLFKNLGSTSSTIGLIDIPADIKSKLKNIGDNADPLKDIDNYSLRITETGTKFQITEIIDRTESGTNNIWNFLGNYEYNDDTGVIIIGDREIPTTGLTEITLPGMSAIGFVYGQLFYWKGKYFGGLVTAGEADEQYESVWSAPAEQSYPKMIEDPYAITKNGIRTDRLQISAYDSAYVDTYPHTQTVWRIFESNAQDAQPVVTITKLKCNAQSDNSTTGESAQSICKRFLRFTEDEDANFRVIKTLDDIDDLILDVVNHKIGAPSVDEFVFEDSKTYYWDAQYKSNTAVTEWTNKRSFIIPEKDFIFTLNFGFNNNKPQFELPLFWNLSDIASNPLVIEFSHGVNLPGEETDLTKQDYIPPRTSISYTTQLPDSFSSTPISFICNNVTSDLTIKVKYRHIIGENDYIRLMHFLDRSSDPTPEDPYGYEEDGMMIDYTYQSFMDNLINVVSFGKHIERLRFSRCTRLSKVSEYLPHNIDRLVHFFSGCISFNQDLDNWDTSNINVVDTVLWFDREFSYVFKNAENFNGNISTWQISNIFGEESKKVYDVQCTGMFMNAKKFNGDVSKWNMSRVDETSYMFQNAQAFNSDISNWDVSIVINMISMFKDTYAFNANISSWNVSNVISMTSMFENSREFNSDLSNWGNKINQVISFAMMFKGSQAFDKNLSSWILSTNINQNINMSEMFYNAISFDSNISGWDVSRVNNMSRMFSNAHKFNQDLSSWDVSNVVDMTEMFKGAIEFSSNINNWNVSKVTNFSRMFEDCSKFNGVLSNWTFTSIVPDENTPQNMSYMFKKCNAFTGKGLSTWDLSRVTNVSRMFEECINFIGADSNSEDADGIELWGDTTSNIKNFSYMFLKATNFNRPINSWDTSSAINMSYMFQEAKTFNQDLNSWDVSSVTDMSYMFHVATLFGAGTNIDPVKNWKTTSLKNVAGMFYGAASFNSDMTPVLNDHTWDMSNVTDLSSMFRNATRFQGKGLENWVTGNVTTMSHTFAVASSFEGAISKISNWNVSKVTSMARCFYGTPKIGNLDLSNWDVRKVLYFNGTFENSNFNGNITTWRLYNNENGANSRIDMSYMFRDNNSFNQNIRYDQANNYWNTSYVNNMAAMFTNALNFNGNISGWKTSNVVSMASMFAGKGTATTTRHNFNQNISSWDVSNVRDMSYMFSFATLFNQPIGQWGNLPSSTNKVTNMRVMFRGARSFNADISSWDVSNVTNMAFMFNGAVSFNNGGSANIAGWVTRKVTDMSYMFDSATAFKQPLINENVGFSFESLRMLTNVNPLKNFLYNVTFDVESGASITPLDRIYQHILSLITTNRLGNGWEFHAGKNAITPGIGEVIENTLVSLYKWRITRQAI